jgi:hypothetical protein
MHSTQSQRKIWIELNSDEITYITETVELYQLPISENYTQVRIICTNTHQVDTVM